ncbi:hypothetical protein MNBD_ALPHA04-992 [hydrothermal vent metagenome]|uniref:Prepilin peptidase n=1 Tax=hydrothermal vent metagenome TaxID=652676 RepID=A0A3B0SD54_9ZZZZ
MPDYVYPIAGILLGVIIGSFLATLVCRWPVGVSVMAGRSKCDHCEHQLSAGELVPIISHLMQSGKCRNCGQPVGSDHIVIEIAAGLIGGFAFYVAPVAEAMSGAIFGWILLTLAALDAKHQWLPDRLTVTLAIGGLASSLFVDSPDFTSRIFGGVLGFSALFLIARTYRLLRGRDGLGGGDPKLLGAIGCWLGWQMLPFVILGSSLIGLLSLLGMRFRGEAITASAALPFGSFMAIAAFPMWLLQTYWSGQI